MVRWPSLHCSLTCRQITHIVLLHSWALCVAEDPNLLHQLH